MEKRYLDLLQKYRELQKAFDDTLEMNRKLGSENLKLEKEIGCLRTIKDELADKEIDLEYLKYDLIGETIADWGRITKEDWEGL